MTEYVAFISYRHRQPDEAAAIRLHRMIEHYNIPADLRPEGRKRPGRVFRDEDELPLSTDLGESIRYALEHSEFLIAICTPEYQKSRWCMEELDSFIAMHGRDRVLAVLVEGTPEESFPPQLLLARDEEGNEKAVEPLAANITASTLQKSLRRLNTEKLRIIASLLGCSFDSLYQREKRYRQRKIMAISALALAVAAVFVGMLLRKNAQIQAQYEETRRNMLRAQLNESAALTENARADLGNGRRLTALRTLLRALPDDPEQPYDASAEDVLTEALRIYKSPGYCFASDITQYSDISAWTLSGDGKTVFTWDSYGIIRAWTASNGLLKWQHALEHAQKGEIDRPLVWCGETQSLLCFSLGSITVLSGEDGHETWCLDTGTDWSPITAFPDPAAGELLVVGDAQNHSLLLVRVDLRTGEERNRASEGIPGSYRHKVRLASVSSGRHTGFLETVADTDTWELVLVDTESMQVKHIPLREPYDPLNCEVRLSFTPGGRAVVSTVCKSSSKLSVRLRFFDTAAGEETAFMETAGYLRDTLFIDSCLACSDEYALVSAGNALCVFHYTDPDAAPWTISLPGDVLELVRPDRANNSDVFMCALSNGLSSLIMRVGDSIYLTSDMGQYCFSAGFSYLSAQIDPQSLTVTAVPVNRGNELLVIRQEGALPQMLETQAAYSDAFLSPSGEKAYLDGHNAYAFLSVPEDRFLAEGKPDTSAVSSYYSPLGTPVFTSDESHVIRDQYIISLQDGKVEPLLPEEARGYRPVSAWVPRSGKALTAVMVNDINLGFSRSNAFRLLLDGIPENECVPLPDGAVLDSSSFMETSLWTLGGNGLLLMSTIPGAQDPSGSSLLVYSTADRAWLPISGHHHVAADARAAAANRRNWFVLAEGEKLSLFDSASAVPIWETAVPFNSKAVSGIWPSPDDSLLLVTYGSIYVAVYRAADGQLLNTLSFSSPFSGVPHLQQDGTRLYLNPAGAGVASSCLVLDMESGSLVTSIPRPVFVNLRTNKAYLSNLNGSGLYLYPVYTKDELREMAEKRVSQAAE